MTGGMYSKRGPSVPLGVRAGHPEPGDARPWEASPPPAVELVAPRQRHVLAHVVEAWHEALAIAVRRDGDGWLVLVSYVLPGTFATHEEWVRGDRVRTQ